MHSELAAAIQDIKTNKALISIDEASTKAGVVLRLLATLGWNPFNVEEVKPEYTVRSKRVDYSLRVADTNKVFIEVKRIGENLELHQEQLLAYSFQEGVRLAVLTNGATWWFYLPLNEGAWEQRRFYTVDLFEQDPKDIVDRFIEFLARQNVGSGDAIKSAESLYKSHYRKQVLLNAIPKAWMKIVSDPDDLLVELLIETTEKISGFRPEIADVEKFLSENYGIIHPFPVSTTKLPGPQTAVSALPLPTSKLRDDYINKRLDSFVFLGKTYRPKSWNELLLTVATELYHAHKADFGKCLVLRGSKMVYFSTDRNELSFPKQIADSEYYAEAKLNSNSIVRRSRDLMSLFGYKETDLQVVAQ